MKSEFRDLKLGDCCELITGFPFKSKNFLGEGDGKYKLARGINIKEGRFYWKDLEKTWDDINDDQQKYLLDEGDLLVSMDGSKVGKNWVEVSSLDLPCLLVQRVCCLRARNKINQKYIKYLISSSRFRRYIDSIKTGTSIPHISVKQLKDYPIKIPGLLEQQRIANFLGALDDKIELNQEMNETLEDIAKTLFKSWFIDFDPVRAKAEGRSTGLLKEISDLFPDSFEDSELGEIPKGWKADSLEGIINRSKDKVGDIESKVLSAVNSGELVLSEEYFSKRVFSKDTKKYLKVQKYDFAYNPSRINIGSIGMSKKDYIGAVSPIYIVFKPKQSWQWFLEQFIRLKSTNSKIIQLSSGSVRQSLSYEDFASIPLTLPEINILEEINKIFCSLREKIIHNENECGVLRSLRDTLLPKLISGELRIPNAEKLVEEASI